MRCPWLLAVSLCLAGCALNAGADRSRALNATIGMDEATLVRAVGVPTRTLDIDGHRFLAYDDQRTDIDRTFAGFGGFGGFGRYPGFGGFGGFGFDNDFPVPIQRTCETTYELNGGRVTSWIERGASCAEHATGAGVPAPAVAAPPAT